MTFCSDELYLERANKKVIIFKYEFRLNGFMYYEVKIQ